jgi:hypothetical protein
MTEHEDIERVRQAIMRYRELLDVMQEHLNEGDRMYKRLIAQHAPEDTTGMSEKEIQWEVAEQIVDDTEALKRAVGHMHFQTHQMERDFSDLYGILVPE